MTAADSEQEPQAPPSSLWPPEASRALLDWFAASGRDLPWRRDYSPYGVLVAEIMLQQTRMDRAVEFFRRWMRRFPRLEDVAGAHPDALLKAWEGLGYYSRVRNLRRAAQAILDGHGGRIPSDPALLRALPGIGPYTAGAVASIAFNLPVPAVDANVERVFARVFDLDAPVKSPPAAACIRRAAESLIPPGQARAFNQALMDLGALVCARSPRCPGCPLAPFCRARRLGIAPQRPIPGRKPPSLTSVIATGVLIRQGRVFIQKRLDTGVWAGFWEFPGGRVEPGETPEEAVLREYREETELEIRVVRRLGLVRHAYTRYRVLLHCFLCALADPGAAVPVLHAATDFHWLEPGRLDLFTFPAGHRKLMDAWMPEILAAAKDENRPPAASD
jgi:A/G-specific adenine glycosylase